MQRQTLDWLRMRLSVPGDWQVVRHSVSEKDGGLTWIDRRRQRLQLGWTHCPKPPDLGRLLSDQRSRDLERGAGVRFEEWTGLNGWVGYRRIGGGQPDTLWRAARYEPEVERLIELAAAAGDSGGEAESEIRAVIESFALTAAEAGWSPRVRAFGLDVQPPEPWRWCAMRAHVGQVSARWEKRGAAMTLRRLAAPDFWYGVGPRRWLTEQLRKTATTPRFHEARVEGHAALIARSIDRSRPWYRLIGRRRQRSDTVWRCDACDAVFHLAVVQSGGVFPEVQALRLRCCEEGFRAS